MEPTAAPDIDHPLMPTVAARVEQLAATPPGADAQSKANDILALIAAMLANPAINAVLPTNWKGWIVAATAAVGLIISSGLAGRATVATPDPVIVKVPAEPTPPMIVPVPMPAVTPTPVPIPSTCLNPTGCKCGCVQTGNCVCKNCDSPMLVAQTGPIGPPAAKGKTLKLVMYVLSTTEVSRRQAMAILADPSVTALSITSSIDPGEWPAGSKYGFGTRSIPMPCMALSDASGTVLDVQPWTTAADVVAFVGKWSK